MLVSQAALGSVADMPSFSPADFDPEVADERYIFFSRIAKGGMGETYRAWDKLEGRIVAIKMPLRTFVEKEGFLERFQREARVMQQLQHSHIVPITDVGMRSGLPYFAMTFLPGGSLLDRRARDKQGAPLPNRPEMLHLWLPGIATALDYLHARSVIHRDVKPANIFFDAFGNPFLGDFGVAKVLDGASGIEKEETLTGTNVALGTELYMAPESFAPAAGLTAAIDQYALAVMVYELLVGRKPFTGETAHIIVEVATQTAPRMEQFRQDLPASLVQAVHRGLAKRPEERFANCGEFARHALAHVRRLPEESGVVRLACPQCKHIIRISTQDAGRKGTCPGCRQRLFIAENLSALWTRPEQDMLAAHLSGVSAASDSYAVADEVIDAKEFEFQPLSKPTKVDRPWIPKEYVPWVINGILAAACIIAMIVLVWVFWPRDPLEKNPEFAVVDGGWLEVYPPKGFKISPVSREQLVEYTKKVAGNLPRIRVLKGGLGPAGSIRTESAKIKGVPGKLQSSICTCDVDGRLYSVEVTGTAEEAEYAGRICEAVARWLKKGTPPALPPTPKSTGLRAEYFQGRNFEKKIAYPEHIQKGEMSFNWGGEAPVNGCPRDNFSIRWTGLFIPEWTGNHFFTGYHDDGLRVFIDDEPVVDVWKEPAGQFEGRKKYLLKDKPYRIKIEYFDGVGIARLELLVRGEQGQRETLRDQLRPK